MPAIEHMRSARSTVQTVRRLPDTADLTTTVCQC
jgi:hypothetical protein